jgi:hypothetical protein
MLALSSLPGVRRLRASVPGLLLAVLACALPACGPARTAFDVDVAPGFRREGVSVAVFGLFKDGRMNADVWSELSSRISPAFGAKLCEPGFGDALRELDPKRYDGIDEAARDTGIDAELLAPFGPYAGADLIVVFQMNGRVRTETETFAVHKVNARRMALDHETMTASRSAGSFFGLEMTAMFYSVSTHDMVGQVVMRFTGESVEEAMANFAAKLRATFPGSTCTSWKWDAGAGPSVPAPRL